MTDKYPNHTDLGFTQKYQSLQKMFNVHSKTYGQPKQSTTQDQKTNKITKK